LDEELVAEWLSSTFIYMVQQEERTFTLQTARVSSDLQIALGEQRSVSKKHVLGLCRLYRPAMVFAPGFRAEKVRWVSDPKDGDRM
jgi:hypothetical protein